MIAKRLLLALCGVLMGSSGVRAGGFQDYAPLDPSLPFPLGSTRPGEYAGFSGYRITHEPKLLETLIVTNPNQEAALLFEVRESGMMRLVEKLAAGRSTLVTTRQGQQWVAVIGDEAESHTAHWTGVVWTLKTIATRIDLRPATVVATVELKWQPVDLRTPLVPPILDRRTAYFDEPPSDEVVLKAMKPLGGIRGLITESRDDVNIVTERIHEKLGEPRFYPLIGPARLHHTQWKCTVYYNHRIELDFPVAIRTEQKRVEVVTIPVDHLIQASLPPDPVVAVAFVPVQSATEIPFTVANLRNAPARIFEMSADGKMKFVKDLTHGELLDVQTCTDRRWVAFFGDAAESFDPREPKAVWLLRPVAPSKTLIPPLAPTPLPPLPSPPEAPETPRLP